ncbi:hypothetical protein [Gulosibacter sediminis]|uniref:hypothetical protein n=1 Tax=Gulosibacter sediminis TaxID=1729695 RepID=UPI0024A8A2BB|nr:hypothetical protein [Gulosibacter sediminis]
MRKYLLNGAVLSAVAGIVPAVKTTQESNSTLRIVATWIAVGATLALAVAGVRERVEEARQEELD